MTKNGFPTIICGPHKDFDDYQIVKEAIKESGFEISEVISGKAKGVDTFGEDWAKANKIPIKSFPAKWTDFSHPDSEVKFRKDWNGNETSYNPKAGPIRNEEMAIYAESKKGQCIAIKVGDTPGTNDMIRRAKNHNLKLFIYEPKVNIENEF